MDPDLVKRLIIGAAGTVGAIALYILGDIKTKEKTGKHIHEHVKTWWDELREKITYKLHSRYPPNKFQKILLSIVCILDSHVGRGLKIFRAIFEAQDAIGNKETIHEEELNETQLSKHGIKPGIQKVAIVSYTAGFPSLGDFH